MIWTECDDFMCLQFDRLSSAPILDWPVVITDLFTKVNTAMIIERREITKKKEDQAQEKSKAFGLF